MKVSGDKIYASFSATFMNSEYAFSQMADNVEFTRGFHLARLRGK